MSIQKLPANASMAEVVARVNSLIDAYNNHVHFSRELQFPTAGPDNADPFNTPDATWEKIVGEQRGKGPKAP